MIRNSGIEGLPEVHERQARGFGQFGTGLAARAHLATSSRVAMSSGSIGSYAVSNSCPLPAEIA